VPEIVDPLFSFGQTANNSSDLEYLTLDSSIIALVRSLGRQAKDTNKSATLLAAASRAVVTGKCWMADMMSAKSANSRICGLYLIFVILNQSAAHMVVSLKGIPSELTGKFNLVIVPRY
jgi:hypothetical protein